MPVPRDHRVPDPPPITRRRAFGLLGGLLVFGLGFAVAGVLVLAGHPGQPPYLVAITVGLVGVGVVGFSQARTMLPGSLWSPATLRVAAASAGLPEPPIRVTLYALAAVGVLGNLIIPLSRR